MTYFGKVHNGTIIFDGESKPKEGSIVRIESIDDEQGAAITTNSPANPTPEQDHGSPLNAETEPSSKIQNKLQSSHSPNSNGSTVGQRLAKWAGRIKGGPPDASTNLDHYLYGVPKK